MRIAVAVVVVATTAFSAEAQTPTDATGVIKEKPQEAAAALPAAPPPSELTQEAQGSVGALFNGGNVQGAAAKVGGFYQLRLLQHGLRFDLGLGMAALAVDEDLDPKNGFTKLLQDGTTEDANALDNVNTNGFAKLRYDFFVGDVDKAVGSVYAAGLVFHDSAVNLLARLRADVGYRHYLFNVPKHTLSAEVGGVYTVDNAIFNVDDADTNADGRISVWGDETRFEDSGGVVGARVAIAYSNAVLDNVTFTQGIEVIPNLSFGTGIPVFGNVSAPFESARSDNGEGDNELGLGEATIANSTSQLTVNLMSNLSLAVNLTIGYDNGAISRRNAYTNYDVATSFQLAWKFF